MCTQAFSGIPATAFSTARSIRAVMENWAFAFMIAATTLWL